MFTNRHITRGIVGIDPSLTRFLWNLIDKLEEGADYFQVFKVSPGKVVHISENPPSSKEYDFDTQETYKIFVIDDKTHSTMLLAEEY